ncbi:MAG: helix-turn-helix domain-containing protein [Clostridia bacterium]|nr:helix-turn-helix domain-containing protein [Clostridia bacterium]
MEEVFKKRLLEELQQSKMTNAEFAELIGVSPEMVTQYYTTKKLPKLDTFAKICKVLDVSADYLLGLKDY